MKLTFYLVCIAILLANNILAQVPQAMNYQAVARNASGMELKNQHINVRFSIRDSTMTGIIVYQETDTITTNQFGVFAVKIGSGLVTAGTFSNINWSATNKYLEVELDAVGGQSFTEMGNQELLSVPYALYAQSAGGYNSASAFNHYVGQIFGGGIIVGIWKDINGTEHGLVASAEDVSAQQVEWSNVYTLIGAAAESEEDGVSNTAGIIAQSGHISSAALLCRNYNGGGYTDWYLPSIMELDQCCVSVLIVNQVLGLNGMHGHYCSSTEYSNNNCWRQYAHHPYGTNPMLVPKNNPSSVRAVRKY